MKGSVKKTPKNKNKTIKKMFNLENVEIDYYSKNFRNTKLIPKTKIINYIFLGYNKFLLQQKTRESQGNYVLDLNDCFIIEPNSFHSGLKSDTINLSLQMNPETPLDKLIAYSFYLKQSYVFKKKNGLSDIKYQIGKDIKRSQITINDKLFDSKIYQDDNYFFITDVFYKTIIDELYRINNKYINLNIANKFALLSCQNIFNLITDLITLKLNEILEPETNTVFRPKKSSNIIINPYEISMELGFQSKLIISRNGEPMDPEYPCGNIEFSFYINILHNRYELKNFILSYDINKCGPEIQNEQDVSENKSNLKPEYIIPASIATASIIATPFLIASLGGKKQIKKTRKKRSCK
jgi:hypothetical protein